MACDSSLFCEIELKRYKAVEVFCEQLPKNQFGNSSVQCCQASENDAVLVS